MKAFVFPGQGSQSIGMCKEFYENFSVARDVFEEVNEVLGKDLKSIMFNGPEDVLTDTNNAQPAIMVSSIAVLRVLEKESGKSIEELCDYVAGHSLGEYTALCASESLSLEDTAKLLMIRGRAFADAGSKNSGSMAAIIGSSFEEVQELINKSKLKDEVLCIANDNVIGQIVISGSLNSIDNALKVAVDLGIKKIIKLQVAGAFHSPLMLPAVEEMKVALDSVKINTPKVGVIANYTAEVENVNDIKFNLEKQIFNGVRWRETLNNLSNYGVNDFIEVGSGVVLSKMISRAMPEKSAFSINSIESLKKYLNQ